MAKSSRQQNIGIHVQILQSGHVIAKHVFPMSKHKSIAITDDQGKPLSLPHYPIPNGRLEFIRVEGKKIHLSVEYNWEGFCTSEGVLHNIGLSDKGRREFDVAKGDYGSITRGDLRILFKVAPISTVKVTKHKLPRSYRGSAMAGYLPQKGEWPTVFAALAFLSVVVLGIGLGFQKRGYYKPQVVDELDKSYVIPFVSEYHLRYAPEALQEQLDRRQFLRSTLSFYRALTGVMLGWNYRDSDKVFPTTVQLYRKLYKDTAIRIQEQIAAQREVNDRLLEKNLSVLSIPAVVGESMQGSILRVLDKINIAHQSYAQTLKVRRETTAAFGEDIVQDTENYKGAGLFMAASRDRLKQISDSVVGESDEEMMYRSAAMMASEAKRERERIAASDPFGESLAPENAVPLVLPPGVTFASFVDDIDFMSADARIDILESTQFAAKKSAGKRPVKKLTGIVDKGAIRDYIEGNRYQLKLCYDVALRRDHAAQGTMEWSFRIDTRGQIYEIALISSTIKDEKMAQCIRQKLSKWRFPRPRHGSVEIRYPFQFAPAKG